MSHIPNNPAVAKVSFVGHRDTREWVNTFHVHKSTGALNAADLAAIASAFYNWWHNWYRLAFPASIVLDQIQVRKLDPTDPLAYDDTTSLPEGGTAGAGSGILEAANVTQTISWRTGLAGKKYRGRNYIPGILEAWSSDDRATSVLNTLLAAAADALITTVLGATVYDLGVFHLGPDTITDIVTFVIDAILDSQRRRLPGRGR